MSKKVTPFTKADVRRLTRTAAERNDGRIPAGSLASIAQRVVAKREVAVKISADKQS